MASSKARKDLTASLQVPDMSGLVFATLELTNEAGRKSATALGRNYSHLSNHHRQFLHVNRISQKPKPAVNNDESEYEPDEADVPTSECFEAKWDIVFKAKADQKVVVGSGLTIGKGQSKFGDTRGVDLLVIQPGSHSKGVKGIHALIRFHPTSEHLMLGGVHDEHPVGYILDNETKNLGNGQWHALWQTKNRFFIGELECTITFPRLTEVQLDDLHRLRDTMFKSNGLPTPDKRLPVLPPATPPHRVVSVLIHKHIGNGGFGTFSLGVNINTGDICGVKSVYVKHKSGQQEIANEADFSLRFPGKLGLIQASCVSYAGVTFGPGRHRDLREVFSHRPYPDDVYFILPLGKHDFRKLNRDKYEFPHVVKILHDVVVGLATLHGWGIMHRDVTVANMLVMSDDPPVGALCDFGKAVQQRSATSEGVAPAYAQAPEINGTRPYDARADVWSCGLAFASVLFPTMSKWPSYSPNSRQSRGWVKEVCQQLEKFGSQSVLHGMIAIIVSKMLDYDPKTRPPMHIVLDKWPLNVSPNAQGTSYPSKSWPYGLYGADWFDIQPASRPKRATAYKTLTKSAAAILPSKGVVLANREAADMMLLGQGFTPERPSQDRLEHTIRRITTMAEKQQADEEASTEILTDDELPASAGGGPDWDNLPDLDAPIDGTNGHVSRHTQAGPGDSGEF